MLDVAPAQAARHGRAGHVRHVRDNSNRVASDLVRACHPVGVNDGMRGPRGTAVGSGAAFRAARRRDRLTPGINSASDPTSARQAAHVTHSTPRNSGSRDCGSAGYGCAPVNRRRRPVTEGGVCVRSVESLIGLPQSSGWSEAGNRLRNQGDDDHRDTKGTLCRVRYRRRAMPLASANRFATIRTSWPVLVGRSNTWSTCSWEPHASNAAPSQMNARSATVRIRMVGIG